MTKHGKSYLLWFVALALILACTPAMVTPIPPLNPYSINTYVAQTAGAASSQTLAANQLGGVLPTFTFTPRSTFTPEPSVTPFQTFIFYSPTIEIKFQYFRIKHDSQLEMYDFKSRTGDKNWNGVGLQTPEVVPLFVQPKLSAGTNRTTVDGTWEVYIDALNDKDKQKLRYLKANNTALFNNAGFPQLESLTMGGNVISITELQGGWGRVNIIDYINPGVLKNVDYSTRPDLIQKFVVVGWRSDTKATYWVNPPPGAIYWPLVSSKPVWIEMDRLEPFPGLPMLVTANTPQEVKREPKIDSPTTGKELLVGRSARVIDYYPSGSNVWGKLDNGGWILLLLYQNGGPQYLTTWTMETAPPPPG